MKTKKMSLANMQGKLSRTEMKNVMAGKAADPLCTCNSADDCTKWNELCIASVCDKSGGNAGMCGCTSS